MDGIGQSLELIVVQVIAFLPKILAALVVFAFALVAAAVIGRAVQRSLERRKIETELSLILARLTRWSILLLGVIVALQQVNFDLTAFLAGLGILGFTVGFALQDVSKNFIAGVLLLLQQPFEIGDVIEVSGFRGRVQTVELRDTQLLTLDGLYVSIPNGDVFTDAVINFSRTKRRRVEVNVGVGYDSDPSRVRETALQAIRGLEGLLEEPPPRVFFHTFGASSVDLRLVFWIDTARVEPDQAVDWGVEAVKAAFEEAAIDIPYPTQQILMAEG